MGFDPLLDETSPTTNRFRIPVSDTQAYRQFGNSVAVPVVAAIARLMRPHIECAVERSRKGRPKVAVAAG
jgi:DNA (cytosine-5)-methyltransferase 1